jgi:hypothetical protein
MECFICTESNPEIIHLGCCSSFAHVDCMAKFIRISGFFRRECPTCKQKLTGRMLHYLNGYFTGEGELVCNIQELVKELLIHKIPIIKLPINDQICFRIYTKHLVLSILACKPKNTDEDYFFETSFIDINEHILMSSIKQFSKNKIYDLIDYILNINVY